jgi:hypothetical protein
MMVLVVVSGLSKSSVETIADEWMDVYLSATRWLCPDKNVQCELD